MKLKQFRSRLQSVEPFGEPKIELEQYPTEPDIAARMLFTINDTYDGIEGKMVADLGCGTGMLGIAAAMLGAGHVVGVDIDSDALQIAISNAVATDSEVDFVRADVTSAFAPKPAAGAAAAAGGGGSAPGGSGRLGALRLGAFDTVLMNPPFGTRDAGADVRFVRAGLALCKPGGCVYSLHKSSTRQHLLAEATKSWGCSRADVVAEVAFVIPRMYAFHRDEERAIEVDIVRYEKAAEVAAAEEA